MTPWTAVHQTSLPITNSRTLLKLMSIKSVMPSNHLILCCPLLLLSSIFPSIRYYAQYAHFSKTTSLLHNMNFNLIWIFLGLVWLTSIYLLIRASLVVQRQRIHLPMQEMQFQSLGGEDPLEKEMATHSSILAWEIPWTEEPDGLQSTGSQKLDMA